jgi:hypothetical protein
MGFGGISVWQLVIVLIVFLLTLIAAPILHAHRSRNIDEREEDDASNGEKAPPDSDGRSG